MFDNLALSVDMRCTVFFVLTKVTFVYLLDMWSFTFFPPFPRLFENAPQEFCGLDGIVPNQNLLKNSIVRNPCEQPRVVVVDNLVFCFFDTELAKGLTRVTPPALHKLLRVDD